MPAESNAFTSTIRVDGRQSAPTVASVMALGSGTFAAIASSNHFVNCCNGSLVACDSSRVSRS